MMSTLVFWGYICRFSLVISRRREAVGWFVLRLIVISAPLRGDWSGILVLGGTWCVDYVDIEGDAPASGLDEATVRFSCEYDF